MTESPQAHIWITDDDLFVREALSDALCEHYRISQLESGEALIEQLVSRRDAGEAEPDLILLDIEMQMLDGYETCRRLRTAGLTMPVIFVSSRNTLEERLQAFDVGGDDFVSKPFDAAEILRKVQLAVQRHLDMLRYEVETELIQETTHQILHQMGETGVLLSFLRDTLRVDNYRPLATKLMQAASEYGVQCHVQVRSPDEAITVTPGGEPSELELSILAHATTLGREFRMGRRLIINYDLITLLVLDMPRDEMNAQRLIGYLNVLVESAEAVTETIGIKRESATRAESMMIASAESYNAVDSLRTGYYQQRTDTRLLLQELIDSVERTYVHLGLTDRQEDTISDAMRLNADKILTLFESGMDFDGQFALVLDSLGSRKNSEADVWL